MEHEQPRYIVFFIMQIFYSSVECCVACDINATPSNTFPFIFVGSRIQHIDDIYFFFKTFWLIDLFIYLAQVESVINFIRMFTRRDYEYFSSRRIESVWHWNDLFVFLFSVYRQDVRCSVGNFFLPEPRTNIVLRGFKKCARVQSILYPFYGRRKLEESILNKEK